MLIEFTAAVLTFFTLLFGVIEFSHAYYQWNAATKAMQHGARLAAVSDPVLAELRSIDGLSQALPGQPYAGSYDVTCGWPSNGTQGRCTCVGGECPGRLSLTYNERAMWDIVYGRGRSTPCAPPSNARELGMCHIFPRIEERNVVVRYTYTGLGYAGRPGGPVPTVTVSLQNLEFPFILLGAFLPTNSIPMPDFATTVTGEDLYRAGSS